MPGPKLHPKLTSAIKRILCGICLLFATIICSGQTIPSAPTRWVTDASGFLSRSTRDDLDSSLEGYQRKSGHQVLVWIGKTTGGDSIDDWAHRAFTAWKIGRKGIDDGVVLFVMADDRTVRIEVGYGQEGDLPDATASRIINETLLPGIKAGDRDGAVSSAVTQIVSALGGKLGPVSGKASTPVSPWQVLLGVLGLIALVALGIRYPVFGYYLLMIVSSALRRGGGGGGGGGMSSGGGGGRSGGGGASGKW